MNPDSAAPFDLGDSKSTLFEKLDPTLRRKLDKAIIDRTPAGCKALFEKFNLAAHGVSYSALYAYARRLRTCTTLFEFARQTAPADEEPAKVLPDLVAQRLLDAVLDEAETPGSLHRLADCWRLVSQTHAARQRLAITLEADRKRADTREMNELVASIKEYERVQQARLARLAASPESTRSTAP